MNNSLVISIIIIVIFVAVLYYATQTGPYSYYIPPSGASSNYVLPSAPANVNSYRYNRYFQYNVNPNPPIIIQNPPEQVFCPMDAMQCPDGSYVGRTGPNCIFVCP